MLKRKYRNLGLLIINIILSTFLFILVKNNLDELAPPSTISSKNTSRNANKWLSKNISIINCLESALLFKAKEPQKDTNNLNRVELLRDLVKGSSQPLAKQVHIAEVEEEIKLVKTELIKSGVPAEECE